jgi:hypothetical protein
MGALTMSDHATRATTTQAQAGYSVNTRDSTAARRRDVDLPLADLLAVLEDLDNYREPALTSLALVRAPVEVGEDTP